jgi:hypothetical protein
MTSCLIVITACMLCTMPAPCPTQIVDHKKITCGACLPGAPPITAYTAYHVDCVRKHFLRHHLVSE